MTNSEIVFDIVQKGHRGRENVITRDVLREKLRLWNVIISDRKLRNIYSKLPICTCDQGVFYPIRVQEIEEYRQYLKNKAIPLFERWKMVVQAHPNLLSTRGRQMDLFEDTKNLF